MIAIPAIDLRDGACVQLAGGEHAAGGLRLDSPLSAARHWSRCGFGRLHVVDLDAATGRGGNSSVVREILGEDEAEVQIGGGIRDADTAERLLEEGATKVIVGTRALEDPDWLAMLAVRFPGEVIVAADVRGRLIVTRGWAHQTTRDVLDVVDELNGLPLAAVLVTAVHREGSMRGADLFLIEDVAERSEHPLVAAGGIATIGDLRILSDRGVSAAVLGMALYTGAMDPRQVADEFGR